MFAHEMGHYVAARQCGLNVGAPAFYDGQRFSPLARIDKGNVKNLKLAYAVPLGGSAGDEWLEATPLFENGFIYVTDSWGVLYKIDGAEICGYQGRCR